MAIGKTKDDHEDYEGFVEKFKPKLTTDDCMTPPAVYEAVAGYVSDRFGVDRADMVRPFWPGADYESAEYPEGCCVVDNPPFSILAKIKRFYEARGVRYFLFCPSLTALSCADATERTHLVCDAHVVYENGAVVSTSFVTNMGGDVVMESCPELSRRVNEAIEAGAEGGKRSLPKYAYPDALATAAMFKRYAKHGIAMTVRRGECARVSALDSQRAAGKKMFGGGLLLSAAKAAERAAAERAATERAAAERAAAERAAADLSDAVVWELSPREVELQAGLGRTEVTA